MEAAVEMLELLCRAAEGDGAAEAKLEASCAGADRFSALPSRRVRDAVQAALLARRPQAVYLPARAGCLGRFGLPGVRFELPLQALPAQMLLRWWGLIRACGGRPARVVRGFGFSPSFQRDLERLDELYFAPPPASLRELKQQLRQPLPQREEELFAAFAAVDPGFEPRCALLRQLRASGEPYTPEMLAIRPASLRALGLSGGSIAPVRELLLDAVIRAPELNRYETLARMAVELGPLARGRKGF